MDKYRYDGDSEYASIYGRDFISAENNIDKLIALSDLNENDIRNEEDRINNISESRVDILLLMIPKGSPRPRSSGDSHFYVKGAAKIRKLMAEILYDREGLVCTSSRIVAKFYLPTPILGMTPMEIILAEKKIIKPEVEPDFDNLPKSYTDALHNTLLVNDKIIHQAEIYKYYSITPRIEIEYYYLDDFTCEYNKKRMVK